MTIIIILVLGILMLSSALLALHLKDLVAAIISAGVISLLASVLFLILAAPDVAMTEAAIGSGLTTVVFLFTINRIHKLKGDDDG